MRMTIFSLSLKSYRAHPKTNDMFSANTYEQRRNELCRKIGKGLILLPGNQNAPNNYPNNAYYFRQDSTFRYYFGLNVPGITGLLDAETGEAALYGDDFTVEDIIWTGPQPTLREMGAEVGIARTFPVGALRERIRKAIALGRRVHYLPPYRGETKLQLADLLGIRTGALHDHKSVDLMLAVAEMREIKSAEEIEALERAFPIGYAMHTTAMRMCRPAWSNARSPVRSRASPSQWARAYRSPRSSRSTAKRCTTCAATACSNKGGCCSATRAARAWKGTAPTIRAPTPSAALQRAAAGGL